MSQFDKPPGPKVRLGAEPPTLPGQPWVTIYGVRGPACPDCGATLWRQVWSPGRELWCCAGDGCCGGYWGLHDWSHLPEPRILVMAPAVAKQGPDAPEPFVDASTCLF